MTAYPDSDDANSLWTVRAPLGEVRPQGTPVKNGATLRLQHLATGRWLHSHHHRSPLTHQQEISCYGEAEKSNSEDVWRVETLSDDSDWERGEKVLLAHVDTGVWLSSSMKSYPRPIDGQHEVAGASRRGSDCEWTAAEGVYHAPRV